MKLRVWLMGIVIVGLLTACGNPGQQSGQEQPPNQDRDVKELVQDYTSGKLEAQNASVTTDELVVTEDNGDKHGYDLPDDEFFVSIAPYMTETHDCDIHSLTGCQGELTDESFKVHIEDEDGQVVQDGTFKTQSNGFMDLWLPRDKTFHVKIEKDGKTAESELSTFSGDKTCLTNMQML